MAVLHRHRQPSLWSATRVPTERMVVDRNHPLSQGLIGCWVPGSPSGYTDLCGNINLVPQVSAKLVATSCGVGFNSTVVNSGAFAGITAPFKVTVGITCVWVGTFVGAAIGGGSSSLIGISAHNSDTTPYACWSLDYNTNVQANSSTGTSLDASPVGPTPTLGIRHVMVGTETFSTTAVMIYQDGKLFVTGSAFGPPTYNADSLVCLNYYPNTARTPNVSTEAGMIYNRGLTATEVASLSASPYQMLKPAATRIFSPPLAPDLFPPGPMFDMIQIRM